MSNNSCSSFEVGEFLLLKTKGFLSHPINQSTKVQKRDQNLALGWSYVRSLEPRRHCCQVRLGQKLQTGAIFREEYRMVMAYVHAACALG